MASLGMSSITDSHLYSSLGGSQEDGGAANQSGDGSQLFGRDTEKTELLKAYQRVQQQHTSETVLLHGPSGTGKTSLIEVLRAPVSESGGYFCAGKFFQNSGMALEPYSAIMSAFSDLCDLVSQSDDFLLGARKEEIQRTMGEDGYLLSNSISNLSQFLDPNGSNGAPRAPETVFTMFKLACKTFLRVMASQAHPVVLVLDDVQWMDNGSEQLIKMLLEDNEIKHVLLILVYRDEEAEKVLDLFRGDRKKRVDIHLGNLDTQAVHQMMAYTLNTPPNDQTLALSELTVHRTQGNPFYVRQFGDFLEQEGFLKISSTDGTWKFNVETIRRESMLSDTLADVLTKKMQRLDSDVQKILMVASLLGYHFCEIVLVDTLTAIQHTDSRELQRVKMADEKIDSLLDIAVTAGFLEETSDGYQFGHDKLQSSFQSMLSSDENLQLHKVIGETFARRGDADSTYHAAVHLNQAVELFQDSNQRIGLAQISLEAAVYCKQRSAFFNGARLLRAALKIIPAQQRWTEHYTMTSRIVGLLAKMELVFGNFTASNKLNDELLSNTNCVDDKLDTLITCVEVAIADRADVTDCSKAVNKALRILGIKQPSRLTLPHVMAKLLKVKFLLRGLSDEDILGLPVMSDKVQNTAVQLLVYGSIFGIVNDQEKPAIYYALLALELTLKSGLSKFSPNAFAIYSMAELVMGHTERAYRFGNLARTMVDRLQCHQTGSTAIILVNNMVAHWKESLHQLSEPTYRAMNNCLDAGDVSFGIFGAAVMAGFRTCMGDNLAELEEEFHALYSRFKSFKNCSSIQYFERTFQFVLNLRHHDENWRKLTDMSGDIMQESEYIQNAIDNNRRILLPLLGILKLQLAYHYGFDRLAESILVDLEEFKQMLRHGFNFSVWQLFGALTYYERYRSTSHRKYLRKARKFKRNFRTKAMTQCPNATPLLTLLNAEEVAIKGSLDESSRAYDVAINALSNAKLVHLEALANERAAYKLCMDQKVNDQNKADRYFLRAMELYRYGWGATAKCDWLEQRKDRLLTMIGTETAGKMIRMIQINEEFSLNI